MKLYRCNSFGVDEVEVDRATAKSIWIKGRMFKRIDTYDTLQEAVVARILKAEKRVEQLRCEAEKYQQLLIRAEERLAGLRKETVATDGV